MLRARKIVAKMFEWHKSIAKGAHDGIENHNGEGVSLVDTTLERNKGSCPVVGSDSGRQTRVKTGDSISKLWWGVIVL